MATALLHDMIHKEIEVYIDDMIVKSPTREGHFEALDKFLARAEKYNLRLNPKKCIFGITSRKLLGHIVSQKGIEVNPEKCLHQRMKKKFGASSDDCNTSVGL